MPQLSSSTNGKRLGHLALVQPEHHHIPIIRCLKEDALNGKVLLALCCTSCPKVIDQQWMPIGMRCLVGIEI